MRKRMNFEPSKNYMDWLVLKEKICLIVGGALIIGCFILLFITYLKVKLVFGI